MSYCEDKLKGLDKIQIKEEALKWIKVNKGWIDPNEFPEEFQELFLKLLEKEVPKEILGVINGEGVCPKCNEHIFVSDYCDECGQALTYSNFGVKPKGELYNEICGNCGENELRSEGCNQPYNYCPYCGNKINWSK